MQPHEQVFASHAEMGLCTADHTMMQILSCACASYKLQQASTLAPEEAAGVAVLQITVKFVAKTCGCRRNLRTRHHEGCLDTWCICCDPDTGSWTNFDPSMKIPYSHCHSDSQWSTASDGETPRRILCTGYCKGGAIATLAATWAALQCPTADVRCITFGAPMVGNPAFVQMFKYALRLLSHHLKPIPPSPLLCDVLTTMAVIARSQARIMLDLPRPL